MTKQSSSATSDDSVTNNNVGDSTHRQHDKSFKMHVDVLCSQQTLLDCTLHLAVTRHPPGIAPGSANQGNFGSVLLGPTTQVT